MSEPGAPFGIDDGETAGMALAAGGAVALVLGWLLGSRFLRALGLIAAAAGGGLYARGMLDERQERMEATETRIRSALDDLDPIARAQVLQNLAESE